MLPLPHNSSRIYCGSSRHPLRRNPVTAGSLILLSTAVQERSPADGTSVWTFRLLVDGHALEPGREHLRVRNIPSLTGRSELQDVAIEDDEIGRLAHLDGPRFTVAIQVARAIDGIGVDGILDGDTLRRRDRRLPRKLPRYGDGHVHEG